MSVTEHDDVIRFRCECGAVLAARAKLAGRRGKCKKCGSTQVIPAADEGLRAEEAAEGAIGIQEICGVCQTAIEDDDERTTCDACLLPFHEECWRENLGCSAYGCSNVNALKKGPDIRLGQLPAAPPPRRRVARARPRAEEDDPPWDHLLLGAGAIATLVGFVTCGLPTLLVAGLSVWRLVHNRRVAGSVALPVVSLVLSALGALAGFFLSAAFWLV